MLDLFDPIALLALAVILLISFPVHEFAHAWVAYLLGDDTAARQGRLSLNPLRHLDPFGTLMLIATQAFGWAKPVPVAPWRLRYGPRVGHALVAAAGPASNLLMAAAAALLWRAGWLRHLPLNLDLAVILFVSINVGLALFNLIPLGPLDGFAVLSGIVDARTARKLEPLSTYGSYILLGLFMLPFVAPRLNILGLVLGGGIRAITRLLLGY
ncbi:MAG: site-2 protease family protein [Anaerolineae bacterium]